MKFKTKVEMELIITEEDIEEIIDMAGYGIGYWAIKAVVGDDYYEITDEENKKHKLSYKDIINGVKMYIKNGNKPYNIIDDNAIAAENIDSVVADMIIQYACFGELIYG